MQKLNSHFAAMEEKLTKLSKSQEYFKKRESATIDKAAKKAVEEQN